LSYKVYSSLLYVVITCIEELLDWWSCTVRPAIRQAIDMLAVRDTEDRDNV
jgi:hypothetical protein